MLIRRSHCFLLLTTARINHRRSATHLPASCPSASCHHCLPRCWPEYNCARFQEQVGLGKWIITTVLIFGHGRREITTWLQYYIGVVRQLIAVYNESCIIISCHKCQIFFFEHVNLALNHFFWVACQDAHNLTWGVSLNDCMGRGGGGVMPQWLQYYSHDNFMWHFMPNQSKLNVK